MVDAGFADQIFKCLQAAGIKAIPPKAAIFSKKRMFVDSSGRIRIEDEPVVSEIAVHEAPKDLENILGKCLQKL